MTIQGNDQAMWEFLMELGMMLYPQNQEIGTNLKLVADRFKELSESNT